MLDTLQYLAYINHGLTEDDLSSYTVRMEFRHSTYIILRALGEWVISKSLATLFQFNQGNLELLGESGYNILHAKADRGLIPLYGGNGPQIKQILHTVGKENVEAFLIWFDNGIYLSIINGKSYLSIMDIGGFSKEVTSYAGINSPDIEFRDYRNIDGSGLILYASSDELDD